MPLRSFTRVLMITIAPAKRYFHSSQVSALEVVTTMMMMMMMMKKKTKKKQKQKTKKTKTKTKMKKIIMK